MELSRLHSGLWYGNEYIWQQLRYLAKDELGYRVIQPFMKSEVSETTPYWYDKPQPSLSEPTWVYWHAYYLSKDKLLDVGPQQGSKVISLWYFGCHTPWKYAVRVIDDSLDFIFPFVDPFIASLWNSPLTKSYWCHLRNLGYLSDAPVTVIGDRVIESRQPASNLLSYTLPDRLMTRECLRVVQHPPLLLWGMRLWPIRHLGTNSPH